ncbi:MAG: MFS transporter [Pirellulales bacterium]|nr:MFS transporter [Pirellulales bacterium]
MSASASAPSPTNQRGTRREELAWAMYDWASSAWSTLQITVVVSYLTGAVIPGREGPLVYSLGISITMFFAAILSPIIGALADARANKRSWLIAATCLGAGSAILMGATPTEWPWLVAAFFFLTNFGFELCWGIYNGFLPEIADDQSMNRVSAWGFAFGYVGGALALIVALVIVLNPAALGLSKSDAARLAIASMGVWWFVFSLPAFLILRDKLTPTMAPRSVRAEAAAAMAKVWQTLLNLRRYGTLSLFLLGFLFYNDGMQTVITQASVFAQDVLKMETDELIKVILMVQFVSLPGALLVGKLSDWIGAKTTLHINLAIWVALVISAFFVNTREQFWIMAAILALVMGGAQSVSRAIMGFMTPEKHAGEFMGFFNLSGRAVSMLGPMVFGITNYFTGSAHIAIVSLLIFFVVGWALITPVNIQRGKQQAGKA